MDLNDIGLTLEILGFVVFLFIPIRETFNLSVDIDDKKGVSKIIRKVTVVMDNNKVRGTGIALVFIGLAFQYNWLQSLF